MITLGLLQVIWKNLMELRILYHRWNDKNNCVCILYCSNDFLVVRKPYDMFINSNNPKRKVSKIKRSCQLIMHQSVELVMMMIIIIKTVI